MRRLTAEISFASPGKGGRLLIPISGDCFKLVNNGLNGGWSGAVKGAPLEQTLNGLSPIEPAT